jgi:hypothetical protein
MSRMKVTLGVLLAAGALFALSASSASALTMHDCSGALGTTPPVTTGCPEGQSHVPLAGEQTVKAKSGSTSRLTMTIAGIGFEIQCTSLTGTGKVKNIESGGNMLIERSATTVTYKGCSVTKPTGKGCAVPSELTTNSLKAITTAGTMRQKYTPTSGSVFIKINITGPETCNAALKGEKEITGSASSEYTESTGVQFFNASTGSELKYAGQSASFISENTFETENGTKVAPTTP